MPDHIALRRYLQRHIEPALPEAPIDDRADWSDVLVIPAYDEPPALLDSLSQLPRSTNRVLVILVLNRPDSDANHEINSPLRRAVSVLPPVTTASHQVLPSLYSINAHTDLLCYDQENISGPNPAATGVGLARKIGCDIALKWIAQGRIKSQWICSGDADALLPSNYFSRLHAIDSAAVAATFPFLHVPGQNTRDTESTARYELRLHHYVLGLEYAGSPYAYHTLGSCLAMRAIPYSQVRGFPKRAGGEDFYLLNKLAKVGPIARSSGLCIQLQSRQSQRVPFGTGPAVQRIASAGHMEQLALYYHPLCFEALRGVLAAIPTLYQKTPEALPQSLQGNGLPPALSTTCYAALNTMGWHKALAHCQRQSKEQAQFVRHWHQWFDGFRSLKFIHAIRDAGYPDQTLAALSTHYPQLWPANTQPTSALEPLRQSVRKHWNWVYEQPLKNKSSQ